MDFQACFAGHFSSQPGESALRVSQYADASTLHLHPELKSLFDEADVAYALAAVAKAPLSSAQLSAFLQNNRFSQGVKGQLASQLLCAWLLKHGLLQRL